MASAIAQNLDQFPATSPAYQAESNDFHRLRATVDYIPKVHSKLPFNYAPVAWPVIDSDQYCYLSDGAPSPLHLPLSSPWPAYQAENQR
jgi:hypothetical protein